MNYTELTQCSFLLDEDHFIYDTSEDSETVHLFIKSKPHECSCPTCGTLCRTLTATYQRTLQDTPIHGKQTFLHANLYKYSCSNPDCSRQVFTEALPFARSSQVRTDALNTFILGVAIFLSNECASKVLALLGVSVSNDTIQRLYDRLIFEDRPNVEAIGIDDVAIRKGQTYATAIYDMQDHQLLALLEGRTAATLKEWLVHHKKIQFVARDRANAYAKAITDILPDCVQVADRFHLLQNLITHLKEIVSSQLPQTLFFHEGRLLDREPKKVYVERTPDSVYLAKLSYDNSVPRNSDGSEIVFDNKKRDLSSPQYQKQAESRREKQQLIRTIQTYWAETEKKDPFHLAHQFNIHPITLKKYLQMTEEDLCQMGQPRNYKKRKTVMDDYLNIIFKMMQDGHPDDIIYFYLRYSGCDKNQKTVWSYIQTISKNNFSGRKSMHSNRLFRQVYPEDVRMIRRNRLLNYLLTVNPKTKKEHQIEEYLPAIKEKYPIVSETETIFREFHTIIMGDSPDDLDIFIHAYQDSPIDSFCQSIKRDIAPIKNAISHSISSGFVEGNNNKFKLIKRIVYGRSGLVNLSKKCLLAFSATQEDFSLSDLL